MWNMGDAISNSYKDFGYKYEKGLTTWIPLLKDLAKQEVLTMLELVNHNQNQTSYFDAHSSLQSSNNWVCWTHFDP